MTANSATTIRRHSARTHVGFVRKVNEDAILARPDIGLWAVSDGMGGHAAGDFASQAITELLDRLPADLDPAETMQEARKALHEAHRLIGIEANRRESGLIGATVVVLLLSEQHFMCFWVGDSRLYRLREGELEMISTDHSFVGELVEHGFLTWDEAENHPQANQITRAIGVGETLEIDKRRGDIRPGDIFLLCSDGLSKYAGLDVLRRHLLERPIDVLAEELIEIALKGGAVDNISVIVVEA
ncbi:PP2C family protein-serine/threonine phosphatase [Rhizobium sp. GN54]|uniref:PP2C family protein-serine/threonine phosphatase n=1 Tax=Rhizobium sp. GN54 TaxID=2898150 RepID=UPI001E5C7305|nr:protein phosphatase 2C domain-containing protein [Rhizobium sp. GN54]MCD2184671.1 protein phosphatase 2C domain-containing protein [Rhizobium sp. GN54]